MQVQLLEDYTSCVTSSSMRIWKTSEGSSCRAQLGPITLRILKTQAVKMKVLRRVATQTSLRVRMWQKEKLTWNQLPLVRWSAPNRNR